ncbi:MAG TPA: Re/Si-specific NAD(P)(+) transhydrogenase subunit alpha [Lacipirellulaceae bacterium]|nr:Re/Si-specific NAD(P)(+) transhydrogenase subunit alpha [Lacipirellulaceae bacterium]
MIIAVPKETYPGERRVALVPSAVAPLIKSGFRVQIEAKAGLAAGFDGDAYADVGAEVVPDRGEMIRSADMLLQVRGLGANTHNGAADLEFMREGLVLVAPCDPLGNPEALQQLAARGVTLFAMELIPRITRAQSMDVLSSMATIAGYKAVLLAADRLPKMFPLMMTAAGTLTPAKVFVIGAGVAGLQAIATSRRLGALVHAYDVRPAVKEQVESLGATFVEMPLETMEAEGTGGYAKQLGEEFYQRQRELMARTVAASDVCITTAAIPGKPSPRLITTEAVEGMAPGSVIVDLAAERGGNCELTKADDTVVHNGVTVLGPTNLPSEVPAHASQMLSKNLTNFMKLIVGANEFHLNLQDEIVRATLTAYRGEVINPQVRELLGLPPLKTPSPESPPIDHLATK